MTLGEKITHLRSAAGMSQEELADNLSVSRQSVSKWEMDRAQPQIDKILLLLFYKSNIFFKNYVKCQLKIIFL